MSYINSSCVQSKARIMYNYSFRVPTTSQVGVIPQIIAVSRLRGSNNKKFVKIENISYEGKYKVVV